MLTQVVEPELNYNAYGLRTNVWGVDQEMPLPGRIDLPIWKLISIIHLFIHSSLYRLSTIYLAVCPPSIIHPSIAFIHPFSHHSSIHPSINTSIISIELKPSKYCTYIFQYFVFRWELSEHNNFIHPYLYCGWDLSISLHNTVCMSLVGLLIHQCR